MEGDEGACATPGSTCCCRVGGVVESGMEVAGVAEEGSTEEVPRELGVRSSREE